MNDSKYGTQCDTQTFIQEYSEVSLNEVSRDLRLNETEEVQNHGHMMIYQTLVDFYCNFLKKLICHWGNLKTVIHKIITYQKG